MIRRRRLWIVAGRKDDEGIRSAERSNEYGEHRNLRQHARSTVRANLLQ